MLSGEHAQDIRIYIDYAREASISLRDARTIKDLRKHWEAFLNYFGKSIGRMVDYSKAAPELKAWGDRLRRLSTSDDEGLAYLREARNSSEHVVAERPGPSAAYLAHRVEFGGGNLIYGGNLSIVGSRIGGVEIDHLYALVDQGRVVRSQDVPAGFMREMGPEVILQPVTSSKKHKTFPLPDHFFGSAYDPSKPAEVADLAVAYLEERLAEMIALTDRT